MSLTYLTPAGTQTYSKAPHRFPAGCPDFAVSGHGGRITGSDGRVYTDLVSALGAVILGYLDPDVDEAVLAQLGKGVSFSLPTRLEGEVAERVCAMLPGVESVRFQKNGADACDTAVRLARAVTGRERVVNCGYHGKSDWAVADTNPRGVPAFNRSLVTRVPYGNLAALAWALEYLPDPVTDAPSPTPLRMPAACLIMEPVVATNPQLPLPGYLEACREMCTRTGALLVFDEVVTGFRMSGFSAAHTFGAQPDLIASGKAMANGFPLSIVAGRREHMDLLDGRVFCSTTFGGEAVSLAAAAATLDKLRALDVPHQLGILGAQVMGDLAAAIAAHDLEDEARVVGYPQRPVIQWRRPKLREVFGAGMLRRGWLFQGYLNLTLAHVREGIAPALLGAVDYALEEAADTLRGFADHLQVEGWK